MGERPSFFTPEPFSKREERHAQRVLPKVIEAENDIIDARSQLHFDANLFDHEALQRWEEENNWPADELKAEIVEKYIHQKTMYGRFALFLSHDYFPYLKAMDLGVTRDAQDPESILDLRDQYRGVRTVTKEAYRVDELPREHSGRTIHFRHDGLFRVNQEGKSRTTRPLWFIGERNRPLLRFRYSDTGDVVTLPKRMTFGARADLPAHLPYGEGVPHLLADEDGAVRDPEQIQVMEETLDQGHDLLPGIRTLYYITKSRFKG